VRTKRQLVELGHHNAALSLASVGVHLGVCLQREALSQSFAWLLFVHLLTFRRIPVVRWV
jgi:hypothetical protein